jgi:hypothetical protein
VRKFFPLLVALAGIFTLWKLAPPGVEKPYSEEEASEPISREPVAGTDSV